MKMKIIKGVALALGAFTMVTGPLLAEASPVNHYSDYGVVEQSSQGKANNPGALSISNDPYGYSGAYTDSESGLQYLQVRYYNPMIMRFTSMDTYSLMNRYAYANENPIMDDDPSGHSPVGINMSGGNKLGEYLNVGGLGLGGLGAVAAVIEGAITMDPLTIVGGAFGLISGALGGVGALDKDLSSGAREGLGIASLVTGAVSMGFDAYNAKSFFEEPSSRGDVEFSTNSNTNKPLAANLNVGRVNPISKLNSGVVSIDDPYFFNNMDSRGSYGQDIFMEKYNEQSKTTIIEPDGRYSFFSQGGGTTAPNFKAVDPTLTTNDVQTLEELRNEMWFRLRQWAADTVNNWPDPRVSPNVTGAMDQARESLEYKTGIIGAVEARGTSLTEPGKKLFLNYSDW